MLLIAVSNWKFRMRSASSCSLPSSYCVFRRALQFFALGDVLVGRHPAAAGHRVDGVGDDAPVGEFLDRGVERDVAPDALRERNHRRVIGTFRPSFSRCRISSLVGVPGFTCSGESPYISV